MNGHVLLVIARHVDITLDYHNQGWLSPRQKGISPLTWGETGEKRGEMAENGEKGEKLSVCLF